MENILLWGPPKSGADVLHFMLMVDKHVNKIIIISFTCSLALPDLFAIFVSSLNTMKIYGFVVFVFCQSGFSPIVSPTCFMLQAIVHSTYANILTLNSPPLAEEQGLAGVLTIPGALI